MTKHTKTLLVILFAVATIRFIIVLNLPILFLPNAMHDDGLFMRLATTLASGHWLGPFNQFTLMKGPGYPAFLAVTSLSGLPLSATHALFQITAIAVTALAVYRLTASRAIGALIFFILTFYPVGFMPDLQRVLRSQIYWAQSLLVYSLFAMLFFRPPRGRSAAMLVAALAGLILGWAWLTREEGVWFIPGLGLLAVGAIVIHRKERNELFALARNFCIAAVGFVAVNAAFMTGNLIAYGSFVGVDFKEHNFKSVLEALEDVDIGPIIPYVPVPLTVRTEVAKISPTFSPLSVALAPGGASFGWSTVGCNIYKQTCGDIAGGWFMWALRDAAALNNFYQSPKTAVENFGKIAKEIATACSDGRLRCHRRWVSYMPRLTGQQWRSIPTSLLAVVDKVGFLNPPIQRDTRWSSVNDANFERYWSFLNYPHIYPIAQTGGEIIVRGWYHDSQSIEWPAFKAYAGSGQEIPSSTVRLASPDIQQHFSDERADKNRFQMSFRCFNTCTIAALKNQRSNLRLVIDRNQPMSAVSGGAVLYVDSVSGNWNAFSFVSPGEKLADKFRAGLVRFYRVLMPLLLLAGVIAAFTAIWRAFIVQALDVTLLTAVAAWALLATRIVILTLVDVSSFPAVNFPYSSPANYLAVVAAFLSIAALVVKPRPT
jgi:hypothetical protein